MIDKDILEGRLARSSIFAIKSYNDGSIWFGADSGVYRYYDDIWTMYITPEGHGIYMVRSIAVGLKGALFGTESGIYQYGEISSSFKKAISSYDITNVGTFMEIPAKFIIEGNYPNPFNPTTTIEYSLPQDSHIILSIYNISGQFMQVLKEEYQQAGNHSITWNAAGMPSGLYFCTLHANGITETRKMVLVR